MQLAPKLIVDGIGNWVFCHEMTVGKQVVMGRSSSCDVQLKNLQVSSQHAKVTWEGDVALIEDLGSSNATYLNTTKVTGKMPIKSGDVITIKPYTITYQFDQELKPAETISGLGVDELLAMRRGTPDVKPNEHSSIKILDEASAKVKKMTHPQEAGKSSSSPVLEAAKASTGISREELRQLSEALESAKRANQRLVHQLHMQRLIMFAPNAQQCYELLLAYAQAQLNAEVAFMMLINPTTQQFEVQCRSRGFEDFLKESTEAGAKSPVSLTLVTQSLQEKRAILTQEMKGGGASESIMLNQITAGIAAPLVEGDQTIGCLYLDRRENVTELYSEVDAQDAKAFADIMVEAHEFFLTQGHKAATA